MLEKKNFIEVAEIQLGLKIQVKLENQVAWLNLEI